MLGGTLSIYLGYRLFQIASLKSEGAGKFKAAAFEFSVSRVGPGVFFALFGAYVLYTSLTNPISVARPAPGGRSTQIQQLRTDLQTLHTAVSRLPEADRLKAQAALDGISGTIFQGMQN